MPELDRDAPLLANLSDRVTPKWLVNWLLHPQAMRTHTTMPRLLHGETAQTDATNIAAYLLADEPNSQDSDAQTDLSAAAKKGMVVYEDRGCIACHRFSAPETEDEFDRLSFHFIAEKYRPGALANFLADPRKHYQWSRMPVVPLSPEEAQQLEAYIRKNVKGEIAEVSLAAADAAAGKTSFTRLGCVQCHKTASENPSVAPTAKPWLELSKGCLSDGEIRNSPDFKFTDDQRTAIGTLLQTDGNSLKQSVSTEFTQRQVANLSCIACHQRDNDDADYPYVLLEFGERGLAPDAVPSLTWVGEKLQPQWVEQLILGKLAYRPRPHFRTRMPAFPARGKQLTVGLTHQHGFGFEEDPRPQHDEKLAAIGKQVAAMQTGLACHRCHAIGDKQAVAPMEARSTNLTYATNRLRHEFYLRWMTDPLRIDPATKMIKFAQDGKKTGLESHYDGDAEKQFKAVWHYLESLRKEKAK
jgi:mono/diheme cytochrome c family protein